VSIERSGLIGRVFSSVGGQFHAWHTAMENTLSPIFILALWVTKWQLLHTRQNTAQILRA